eukprot:165492-Pleurochrysis_carterae.AAC.1
MVRLRSTNFKLPLCWGSVACKCRSTLRLSRTSDQAKFIYLATDSSKLAYLGKSGSTGRAFRAQCQKVAHRAQCQKVAHRA